MTPFLLLLLAITVSTTDSCYETLERIETTWKIFNYNNKYPFHSLVFPNTADSETQWTLDLEPRKRSFSGDNTYYVPLFLCLRKKTRTRELFKLTLYALENGASNGNSTLLESLVMDMATDNSGYCFTGRYFHGLVREDSSDVGNMKLHCEILRLHKPEHCLKPENEDSGGIKIILQNKNSSIVTECKCSQDEFHLCELSTHNERMASKLSTPMDAINSEKRRIITKRFAHENHEYESSENIDGRSFRFLKSGGTEAPLEHKRHKSVVLQIRECYGFQQFNDYKKYVWKNDETLSVTWWSCDNFKPYSTKGYWKCLPKYNTSKVDLND